MAAATTARMSRVRRTERLHFAAGLRLPSACRSSGTRTSVRTVDREWLERRLSNGLSVDAIAADAGCSASSVGYWINHFGLCRNEPSRDAVVSKRTNFVRSSNKVCRFDRWPLPVVSAPQQFAAGFADTTFEPAPLATRDGMGRSRTRFCASAQPMAGRHSVEWVAWVAIAAPVAAPPASAYDAVASGSCSSPRQAVHARSAATTGIRARCSSTTSSRARNGFTSRRAGSRVPWLGFEKRPESACYSAPTATRRWKLA